MKEIIVKFSFTYESLEGYENCDDQLIIEDHLMGCAFDNVGFEIINNEEAEATRLEKARCLALCDAEIQEIKTDNLNDFQMSDIGIVERIKDRIAPAHKSPVTVAGRGKE